MLNLLQIKNVALIDDLTIEFNQGFNVLLGETGAGKSIIFDALNFVLGYKADKTLIRHNEQQMKVVASFSILSNLEEICELLNSFGIETDDNIILYRTLSESGKSDCKINGVAVTVKMLNQLSSLLLDAYGQHDNQLLLKTKKQIFILDSYKAELLKPIKEKLHIISNKISEVDEEIKRCGGFKEDRQKQIEFYQFQFDEITKAELKNNEDEELKSSITKLANSEKIISGINDALENLFDNSNSALSLIKNSLRALHGIENFDSEILELSERLNSLKYELEDVVSVLKTMSGESNYDENLMDSYQLRLELIRNLTKKYGGSISAVLEYVKTIEQKLDLLVNAEEIIEKKTLERNKLIAEYFTEAEILSVKRKKIAEEITKKLSTEFEEVGMKQANLKIDFKNAPDSYSQLSSFGMEGFDEIEFLFAANAGEEFKPLSKTISGGEMSRFMLAFKNILAESIGVETLLFDEVDSGISGQTGKLIAEKLGRLSRKNQIICITHLPQVAAMADCYFYVSKETRDGRTFTSVKNLDHEESIKQTALLIGGNVLSDTAYAHAKEMKIASDNFKNNLNI